MRLSLIPVLGLALALPLALCAADSSVLFEPSSQIPAEGGPGGEIAFFPGGTAFLSGGVGSVSIGHGVELGVGGYSLASEYVPSHDGVTYDVGYSYVGLLVDYTFFKRSLLSVNTSFLAGPAQGWSVARAAGADRVYSNFGQIEPSADLMLNVTHQLRLGLGVSWRFCAGSDLDGVLGTDLNGGAVSFLMLYGQN
ncbi:MAG: hypothetical protein ACREKE_04340 [bacterium]